MMVAVPDRVILEHELARDRRVRVERRRRRAIELLVAQCADRRRGPMQYLTLWRMQLASRLLIDGDQVAAATNRNQRSAARSRRWSASPRPPGGMPRDGSR